MKSVIKSIGNAGIPTPPKKQNNIQLINDMNPIMNTGKDTSNVSSASSFLVQLVVINDVELDN